MRRVASCRWSVAGKNPRLGIGDSEPEDREELVASLHLDNIPPSLYTSLRERALHSGRSVEEEAVACLDAAVSLHPRTRNDTDRVLRDLERFRSSLKGVYVTEEQLQRMKREGRP